MSSTQHPRLLARIAGVFYLIIFPLALFAYVYVRGQLIVPGDMARTAANIIEHERLYRAGLASAVVVAMCNLPLGLILYELLKVVNQRIAQLALLFILVSATLEAGNALNHFQTLLPVSLTEYLGAFGPEQQQALARGPIRLFNVGFSVALSFFGVFCLLTGYLVFRSTFLPAILGVLMAIAGVCYLLNSLVVFLDLPDIPYILLGPFIGEASLALWLVIRGVDETRWREQATAIADRRASG
jgi:hypothetical protein